MNNAVFLDRDGTIIEDRGHLSSPEDAVFYKNTFEALRRLQERFKLFIITNQSGIGKGLISRNDVEAVNGYVNRVLLESGIKITETYVCPHKNEDFCSCKKPKPYFLRKSEADYDINLMKSYSVGDHPSDYYLAENAGGKGIYLLTGHGLKHRKELPENALTVKDIGEAADIIFSQ
ncbi:D,D-heptose 1,7-bisphosphate phosphatase [Sedimentisphaera cyanobacteriorum]|uniref:D,D-heptose 1,7-bisphosphate phosphatase n=1 Tax=Sedimentisphaera cyanobacteriorum TaxID=1940790 RepID=A0A1Q2HN27_9BACT|nr:HAD family hydrolase [Sedimentisphaera cyanobacteriorum]AQQ08760.1 D,D-heptose 1,7-bisphosphate phosphatase [Sedimentisphaera cyanobacteriorum]